MRSTTEARAYWRDVGTIDAYWAANIDLTEVVPDLDIYDRDWPIWTYVETDRPGEVRPRRRRAGAARPFPRWFRAAASSPAPRLRNSLLFSGVRVNSYAHGRTAVVLPDVDIGRSARLRNVVVDRGVRIPPGLVVGEDPELDAARFRRTEGGVCLDHPADDRPARVMKPIDVLSVASEIYPLVKTGGLADVAGALPGALRAEDVALRTPGPRLSGRCWRRWKRPRPSRRFDDLFGGPARLLAGRAGGLDLFVLDAPAPLRPRRRPLCRARTAATCADNALRFAALARVGAALGQGLRRAASRRRSSTPTTGRPA